MDKVNKKNYWKFLETSDNIIVLCTKSKYTCREIIKEHTYI